jgi:hypothetical protein
MAVRIDLANAALGHIGEGHLIANLATDRTPAGIAIKRFYDQCRQSMIAEHDWQWARRWTTVTGYSPVPETWAYAYLRPAGCASVRVLLSTGAVLDYGIGGATDSAGVDVNLILTQLPATHVVWTRDVVNEAHWPLDDFPAAFTYRLAALICRPLAKDEATAAVCWERYGQFLQLARAADQRQMRTAATGGQDYLSARQ